MHLRGAAETKKVRHVQVMTTTRNNLLLVIVLLFFGIRCAFERCCSCVIVQ